MIDVNQLVPVAVSLFTAYSPDALAVLVLPAITEILNKDIPDDQEGKKYLIALVACFLISAIVNWHSLLFGSINSLGVSFLLVLAGSQTLFKLYFKNSFIRAKLQGAISPDANSAPDLQPVPDAVG